MLYLKLKEIMVAIEEPRYVVRLSNGTLALCDSYNLAMGVLSPDGMELWQLLGRGSLGGGFPVAQQVTMAEYDEWEALRNAPSEPDPEDTDPVIPEDVEPETVLTRAELTEKVNNLEEALDLLLSGVTEDE